MRMERNGRLLGAAATRRPPRCGPASKKPKVTVVAAPRVVAESQRVKIDEVDVSDESGWRGVDRSRVDELKETFRKGQFGVNL